MHIAGIKVENIPPFAEAVDFEFDEHVNVFIGPNATGKSTLLGFMAEYLGVSFPELVDDERLHHRFPLRLSEDWPVHKPYPQEYPEFEDVHLEAVPRVMIPSIRVGSTANTLERSPAEFLADTVYVYDKSRIPSEHVNAREMLKGASLFSSILYAERVEHATTLLFESDEIKTNREAASNFLKAILLATDCAQEICDGVISMNAMVLYDAWMGYRNGVGVWDDEWLTRYHLTWLHSTSTESGLPVESTATRYFGRIDTTARSNSEDGGWRLATLSSGTEGTVWWTRLVALDMAEHYGFADGWENRPAILLVDEIENHLHPTWQRRVIPALLRNFPGLQIFATTHSPFIVAGLKKGQVHLLNRDQSGVVTATRNTEDIVGWTADEILKVFMDVEDPTDKDTADAAAGLRKLRDEGPRESEREEEARQSEIASLRQIVDRAELSSLRAAEDNRFLSNLEAILEQHRQKQDLNQENG